MSPQVERGHCFLTAPQIHKILQLTSGKFYYCYTVRVDRAHLPEDINYGGHNSNDCVRIRGTVI